MLLKKASTIESKQSESFNVINNIEINLCSLAVICIIEIKILFYFLLFFDNVLLRLLQSQSRPNRIKFVLLQEFY